VHPRGTGYLPLPPCRAVRGAVFSCVSSFALLAGIPVLAAGLMRDPFRVGIRILCAPAGKLGCVLGLAGSGLNRRAVASSMIPRGERAGGVTPSAGENLWP
jgi:hypothetical protein